MGQIRVLGFVCALSAIFSGCSYSLPLGGIAPGRGQPVGERMLQAGVSRGTLPELAGTLPALFDASGTIVNPVPESGETRTGVRGLDLIGVTVGFTDAVDVGLNFSRGLHAFVRVLEGSAWSMSLSPAVFSYTSRNQFSPGNEQVARVTNLNLTGLLSVDPWKGHTFAPELYVGGGASRYSGWIEAERARSAHADVVPSVLAGLNLVATRCPESCETSRRTTRSLGVEVVGTWLQQRNGRRDFVPVMRAYLSMGLEFVEQRLRR